jgi:hypothetical protein
MYPWETLYIYSQQDERWFEPVGRHVPGAEYLSVYRALVPDTWRLRRRGLWFIADPPGADLPEQGWKLHVSVRTADGAAALRAAIPVLRDNDTHFKFLVDRWSHAFTNGKLWPRGSSGKFITAYPPALDEFRVVAQELAKALAAVSGPYILSDRRVPDSTSVYYRYGGFTGQPRLRPDGVPDLMITAPDGTLYPDIRQPYWSAPPWVTTDPFGLDAHVQTSQTDGDGLDGGRFRVESAISFSNRGGVYRAVDTTTGEQVVLKEARPHIGLGNGLGGDIDVTDLLRKEYRLLSTLADTGYFVRPVALFQDWEHLFLAEEHVDGESLGRTSIATNPLYAGPLTGPALAAYHGRMRGIFAQLADAIAAAHRRGITLADLSYANVLIDADDRIRVIDLEGAVEDGVDSPTGLYTPGFSGGNDFATLGAMMFGAIVLNTAIVAFDPAARLRFLAEVQSDLGVPDDLVALVEDLTSGRLAQPGEVARRIGELSVGDPASWPAEVPLARPAAEELAGERPGGGRRLRARIRSTLAGVTTYLVDTASPLRPDRLFPADLGVFETNPCSVAYGAAGVLRALYRLCGEVPPDLLAWLLAGDFSPENLAPGLYLGAAGIAWTLDEVGEREAGSRLMRQTAQHPLLLTRADVLHGCAGYGLAALRFWHRTGEQHYLDEAVRVGAHLAATAQRSGRASARSERSEPRSRERTDDPAMCWRAPDGRLPIGYAYGASGVALFLLYLHRATGDADVLRWGRRALDFDLAQAMTSDAGYTSFLSHVDDPSGVGRTYWDQGTAGVVTTLVRYQATTGDERLTQWVDRLVPDLVRKYAVLPQLFHGLAGIGNALLDVAELTGRTELLAEAARLAEGVLLFAIDRDEGIAFPGEQAMRETGDYATGSAGVALFLDRIGRAGTGRRTNGDLIVDELL